MYVRVLIVCVLATLSVASDTPDTSVITDCPQRPLAYVYKGLGCEPLKENGAECPTSYDCKTFVGRDPTRCHTRTKSYNISESVDDAPGNCQVGCFCSENHGNNSGRPYIICAHVDCPWGFPGTGCTYKYKPDVCCPTLECDAEPTVESMVTCDYDNKTLKEGESFEPSNDPCSICTCKKGFKGVIEEPFCKPIDCNTQLYYSSGERLNSGCAPIFYGTKRCCPIDWKCPEESDAVVKSITKSNSKTTATCTFGGLTLQPGDSLMQSAQNVQCSCDLPPFITCIQEEYKN